jgi:hypothetical protein
MEANTINHMIIFILVAYNNCIVGPTTLDLIRKDCPIQIGDSIIVLPIIARRLLKTLITLANT